MAVRAMTMKILLAVAALLMVGYLVASRGGGSTSPQDAHQLVQGGARLVDVRTPEEFAAGHLDGAINVPVDELEQRLSELGSKDQALVLYCRSGSRSASATRALQKAGFTRVHDLGAMSNW